jgi:hypothetical protein
MRFPYVAAGDNSTSLMPRLTMSLEHRGRLVSVTGLLDTGSTVNVLPYGVGLALGAVWGSSPTCCRWRAA